MKITMFWLSCFAVLIISVQAKKAESFAPNFDEELKEDDVKISRCDPIPDKEMEMDSNSKRAPKTTYTFLLTNSDVPSNRIIGRIEHPRNAWRTWFFGSWPRWSRRYLRVNRWRGTLRFRRRRPRTMRNVRIKVISYWRRCRRCRRRIRCRRFRRIYFVKVNVIVVPSFSGDEFLKKYNSMTINKLVTKNQLMFDASTGLKSSQLLRIMRMINSDDSPEAHEEMMSAVRFETALQKAINQVREKHVRKCPGQLVIHLWSLKKLFSPNALRKLEKESGCGKPKIEPKCDFNSRFRTIDGTCNNRKNLGAANTVFIRLSPARYFDSDGLDAPIGFPGTPNVPGIAETFKVVTEIIKEQTQSERVNTAFSHALMQFGQFLDHDLDLAPEIENSGKCERVRCDGSNGDFCVPCYPILPLKTNECIRFSRSAAECKVKNGELRQREQINAITAFVDASQVYGSSKDVAEKLRDLKSRGLLKTSNGNLLPSDNCNCGLPFPLNLCLNQIFGGCFLAGDVRSNEQTALASIHTLFVREHNRIAKILGKKNLQWNGERIYQETRRIVGAVLQKITYEDFLPIVLGSRDTLPKYKGYKSNVDPSISNAFATAAFRFGHSLIRQTFDRVNAGFNNVGDPVPLRQLFFNNTSINEFGIEPLLLGLLANESQQVDRELAVGLLDDLFERENSHGLNLAALNVQRGRDHGLPGYNAYRKFCKLGDAKTFEDTKKQITDKKVRNKLSRLYEDNPNNADLWPVGLAEKPIKGGLVGATFRCIIRDQFTRSRDGDRFFYESPGVFTGDQLKEIRKASLSRILCDNLKNVVSVQRNAFEAGRRRVACGNIPGMNFYPWKEHREKEVKV